MAERKYLLVHLQNTSERGPYMTLTEVAYRTGVHPELLHRFICLGLIDPVDRRIDGELLFEPEVVLLVRKITRLRNQLGINYTGIGVVLELMRRLEVLESRLKELERDLL